MKDARSKKFVGIVILFLFLGASVLPLMKATAEKTESISDALPEPLISSNDFKLIADNSILKQNSEAVPLGGAVHNINTNQSYSTIQEAINNASNGDIIVVDNGTFPEQVVVNKSITLRNSTDAHPVINADEAIALNIKVNNVTIQGMTITDAVCGILCNNISGITFRTNVFWRDQNGISYSNWTSQYSKNYALYDTIIDSNTFVMNGTTTITAVNFSIAIDYDNSSTGHTVDIGTISLTDNIFYMNGTSATAIEMGHNGGGIYVTDINRSNVTIGAITITGNRMYDGVCGVDFFGLFEGLLSMNLTVADVNLSGNTMEGQSGYGMKIDYYDGDTWSGNTTARFGKLKIQNNRITDVATAISIDNYGGWSSFHDNVTFMLDDFLVNDNNISVSGIGIEFNGTNIGSNGIRSLDGNSNLALGNFLFRNNTIESQGDGFSINNEYWGTNLYDNSTVTIGSFKVTDNTIHCGTSEGYGVDVKNFHDVGTELHNTSLFTMKDIEFNNNTITSYNDSIFVNYIGNFGGNMDDNTSFSMGNITFNWNNITSFDSDGINVYGGIYYFGYTMEKNSVFNMQNVEFNFNKLNTSDDGIYLNSINDFGCGMFDMSTFTMNSFTFNNNSINCDMTGQGSGICIGKEQYEWTGINYFGCNLYDSSNFTVHNFQWTRNIIYSPHDGISIASHVEGIGTNNNVSLYYFARDIEANATFTMDNITFNENNITTEDCGINLGEIYNFGFHMTGETGFNLQNIEFNNNTIDSSNVGIYLPGVEVGTEMNGTSHGSMGDILITNNTILSDVNGIILSEQGSSLDIGSSLYNNSNFTFGIIEIKYNTITNNHDNGSGFLINASGLGNQEESNATFTMGLFTIANNTITGSGTGLHIISLHISNWNQSDITNNTIQGCAVGIHLQNSFNNLIYNNYFNNTMNAQDDGNNTWNVTKKSGTTIINGPYLGGNYWSDYSGYDTDNDSLGDILIPYNASGTIEIGGDYHPLTTATEPVPPDAPTSFTATAASDSQIDLSWTKGSNADRTKIQRKTGSYPINTSDGTTIYNGTGTSHPDTGLNADSSYYYRAWSWNSTQTLWSTTNASAHATTQSSGGGDDGGGEPGGGMPPSGQAPVAHAGGPYNGHVNQSITFNGSTSTDDNAVVGYRWDWTNDGTWDTSWLRTATTTHSYTILGMYTVKLEVRDSGGLNDTDTATVIVATAGVPQQAIIAEANGPYTGLTFQPIQFVGYGSYDSNGTIMNYTWDFGDGIHGYGISPVHHYTTSGMFSVTLTIADNKAQQDNDTATATILLDSDRDNVSDLMEQAIGANITSSDIRPVHINNVPYDLVDINGDGIYDVMYNPATGTKTILGQQGSDLLIDLNGDGIWEYVYDPLHGTTSPYEKKNQPGGFPWMIAAAIAIILAIIALVAWFYKTGHI